MRYVPFLWRGIPWLSHRLHFDTHYVPSTQGSFTSATPSCLSILEVDDVIALSLSSEVKCPGISS